MAGRGFIIWLLVLLTAVAQAAPAEQEVTFSTPDGAVLCGTEFGGGTGGIILVHRAPPSQSIWIPFARRLAEEGYFVLTFEDRGGPGVFDPRCRIGSSVGLKPLDVLAAARHLRTRGTQRIALLGGGLGGEASIKAAGLERVDALVVVNTLAGAFFAPGVSARLISDAELARLTMPSMWITSEEAPEAYGMRVMYTAVPGPKSLQVYPGTASNFFVLLASPHGPDVTAKILGFLRQHMAPR